MEPLEARDGKDMAATPAGRACEHAALEVLGSGGGATYYRCPDCGRVFIEHNERIWTLRPIASP